MLSSDHVIADAEAFHAAVHAAEPAAAAGKLVTFDILPTAAETGYGYIRAEGGRMEVGSAEGCAVAQFVEKHDAATAASFVASGEHSWNSGMFLFRALVYLAELERQRPAMLEACRAVLPIDVGECFPGQAHHGRTGCQL